MNESQPGYSISVSMLAEKEDTHLLTLALISYLPGFLWVWFFYRQDRWEPEPKSLVLRAFLWGALAVLPVGAVESLYRGLIVHPPNLWALFLITLLGIGLVEETGKYLAVKHSVFQNHNFNESMDGIIYAVAAALGFAATENLLYALSFGIRVLPARAVITLLAHATFSGIVGFALGRAKFAAAEEGRRLIWRGLATAAALHGVYDFILVSNLLPGAYALFLLLGAYFYLRQEIKRAAARSPFKDL